MISIKVKIFQVTKFDIPTKKLLKIITTTAENRSYYNIKNTNISQYCNNNILVPEPLHSDTFPHARYQSSDTLCSMDSMSADDHIEVRLSQNSIPPITITSPDGSNQQYQNGRAKFFKNGNAQPVPV